MAGGGTIPLEAAGLAVGAAIRRPMDLPLGRLTAFRGSAHPDADLFPAPSLHPRVRRGSGANSRYGGNPEPLPDGSIAREVDRHCAAGHPCAGSRYIERMLPGVRDIEAGRLLLQPALWCAHGAEQGEGKLLALYSDMGRAFARFKGWRAATFVANPASPTPSVTLRS